MKRSALTAMALLALGVACTDATSPDFNKTVPKGPARLGHIPPPPVDADIAVCVDDLCGSFDGTYFSNGSTSASSALALELEDPSLAFQGTAWVRFSTHQTIPSAIATANARFKNTNGSLSGNGTIQYSDGDSRVVIKIEDVDFFAPNPACDTGQPCAFIHFFATVITPTATLEHQNGEALVFNRDACGEGIFFPRAGISNGQDCTFGFFSLPGDEIPG